VAPISIRFERFTVFHTSTSGGGHDFARGKLRIVHGQGYKSRLCDRETLPAFSSSDLFGFKKKGSFFVFLNRLVAEPPIRLFPDDERLDLILGMGMENSAGNPSRRMGLTNSMVCTLPHFHGGKFLLENKENSV
jgi:hypothetical protein